MRIYRHKTNAFNQFQHKIVIYPEAIVRNAIALNSDKGEYMKDCVVEIGKQQWKTGETKQVMEPEKKLDIRIYSKNIDLNIKKKMTLKELKQEEKVEEAGQAVRVKIQQSGDNLSKIITFMPQRIVRNASKQKLQLRIYQNLDHLSHPNIEVERGQMKPCFETGKYIQIQYNGRYQILELTDQPQILQLHDEKITLQYRVIESIEYIEFLSQPAYPVIIENKTGYYFTARQKYIITKENYTSGLQSMFECKPLSSTPMFYQDINANPKIVIQNERILTSSIELNMNRVGRRAPVKLRNGKYVFISVNCKENRVSVIIQNEKFGRTLFEQPKILDSIMSIRVQRFQVSVFDVTVQSGAVELYRMCADDIGYQKNHGRA